MKRYITIVLATAFLASFASSATNPVRITQADKDRAAAIVAKMTLDEKIDYIGGYKSFYIRPIERLGLPQLMMSDATVGVRDCRPGSHEPSPAYPSSILAAATWDRALMYTFGESIGRDCNARGVNFILGPGVNIYRTPNCGRNFEYMGEDPYLAGETAAQYVLGVQSRDVIATVKHFALNNYETAKRETSSDADERTMMELYLEPFRKAIQEGGAGAVMDSYNLLNCVHTSENGWLNNTVLRDIWGFDGIVMSDWVSVYSTLGPVNGGLDLEMPSGKWMNRELIKPMIESGAIKESQIDEKCQHIIATISAFGFLDKFPAVEGDLDSDESDAVALQIAREGIVLLKNDNALPLAKKGRVLVLGPGAGVCPAGVGSSRVTPIRLTSFADELTAIRGAKNVKYVNLDGPENYTDIVSDFYADPDLTQKGFCGRYFAGVSGSKDFYETVVDATPAHKWGFAAPLAGMPEDLFTVEWTAYYKAPVDGSIRFVIGGDDGYRLSIDGEYVGGDWSDHGVTHKTIAYSVKAGQTYRILFEYYDNFKGATVDFSADFYNCPSVSEIAADCSSIIYCPTFGYCDSLEGYEGEDNDRTFAFPGEQLTMLEKLLATGKPVTVAAFCGGAFDCRQFGDRAAAIIQCWYPGQAGGRALAEIVTGKVSPSGKLPISFERNPEDNTTYAAYHRNVPEVYKRTPYTEGIFVGYRGFDKTGIAPLYPFGYGLSYTTFQYSNLKVAAIDDGNVKVEFDVTNTGRMDADEVSEVYVGPSVKPKVVRPAKELKGYARTSLRKGETKHVEVVLDSRAFSFYDIDTKSFVIDRGVHEIMVGGSSAELPLKAKITY